MGGLKIERPLYCEWKAGVECCRNNVGAVLWKYMWCLCQKHFIGFRSSGTCCDKIFGIGSMGRGFDFSLEQLSPHFVCAATLPSLRPSVVEGTWGKVLNLGIFFCLLCMLCHQNLYHVYVQYIYDTVRPVLRGHCHERPPVLTDHTFLAEGPKFQYIWTCHQRPPVLTDHIFVANGVVFKTDSTVYFCNHHQSHNVAISQLLLVVQWLFSGVRWT